MDHGGIDIMCRRNKRSGSALWPLRDYFHVSTKTFARVPPIGRVKDLVQSGLVIVPDDSDVARIIDELEMFFRQFARASLFMKP